MLKVYYLKISDFENLPDRFFYSAVGRDTLAVVGDYKNERVRRTKLLGEGMTRKLLGTLWGINGAECRIVKGEHGKPYVEGEAQSVFFNLSHSGDYIVCALSDREIGVDIERKGKARLAVARRFFHPEEIQQLEGLSGKEQDDLFFGYWSVKESFLKYTGSGLSTPLSGFEVRFGGEGIVIRQVLKRVPVFIYECPIDPTYKCFVCSENQELPEIQPWKWSI
ncbi:MAG: 4'-phosphopantetheinyl transferase superfamily protein [Odoribacter sp.]